VLGDNSVQDRFMAFFRQLQETEALTGEEWCLCLSDVNRHVCALLLAGKQADAIGRLWAAAARYVHWRDYLRKTPDSTDITPEEVVGARAAAEGAFETFLTYFNPG